MSMVPCIVSGEDIAVVWHHAFSMLVRDGARFNLVLHVRNPLAPVERLVERFDPHSVDQGSRPLLDVANTIFPARSPRWDQGTGQFVQHYSERYERLLRRGTRSWGCYFLRLTAFGDEKIDQLSRVVTGLSTWGQGHKAAFVVHFSTSQCDKPRPQGAPCLQYVQFMVGGDRALSMTAVYRSHDYFSKALGNLVGLSRLLDYVAFKTNHTVGTLSCLSTYAFIDATTSKAATLMGRTVEQQHGQGP